MCIMNEDQDKYSDKSFKYTNNKPSVKSFFLVVLYYLTIGFIIFLVIGFLTDGYGTGDDGNVAGKECFNYEMPNGDWANSCDL